MVIQRRINMEHASVFPAGAFLKGAVEPVTDFNAPRREDGSRPQQADKETGLLVWQVIVIDADEEASKKDSAVSVKFLGPHRPVPPENKSGMPWTPVEFVGLSALPYLDKSGPSPRLAWSFRAEGMEEPSGSGRGGAGNGSNTEAA
ncbi:plasmid replication, integration and excision activator [Dermacoccus nishinomiyaensis]|uniref:plasmid replication, integration and excision activator n=1 Tax=Dermacoccus nishinomiyaensis TaxID=1274 RepID=UPI00248DA542|nr:plasmid replication, integration and excision activator [Dermacoccus nishinomiyaensis]